MMFSDASKAYLKQARLLLRILPLIRRYPEFALKGGTALNFYVVDLPRISVDIDLTYLPLQPRSEALTGITTAMKNLQESVLTSIPGSHVIPKTTSEGYIRGLLIRSNGATVKVEPNHVIRGTVFLSENRSLVSVAEDYFQAEVDFPVLSLPDLYAGKICAALDRQHPRDLFDIHYLLETTGITEEMKSALLVYIISHPRPIAEVLSPRLKDLKEPFESEFRYMTREEVNLKELEDVRVRLTNAVHESLNEQDRQFLLSIKSGTPDWSLHPVDHVRKLPAVQWKLNNIWKLSPSKHKTALKKLEIVLKEGPACSP